MITNLQTYFEKHYRWMFAFLLVIIVIPFVFAYGPGSSLAKAQKQHSAENTFFGHDLSNEAHVQELARQSAIGLWLKTGYPPFNANSLQTLVLERIVQLHLVDALGVPSPSQAQLSSYIASLPPFQDAQGNFSSAKFKDLQERFAKEQGITNSFLVDRIAERWRIDQLADTLEAGTFILPTSLQREYSLVATQYSILAATLPATPNTSLSVSDEESAAHYAANKNKYRSAEMREGLLYSLPADKFTAQVPAPTEEQLQKYFDTISMRFLQWQVSEDGKVTGTDPKAPTLAEHREETLKLYTQSRAVRAAAEAVDAIVQKIYSEKIAPGSAAWDDLIKASGLSITPLTPAPKVDGEETSERLFARSLQGRSYTEAYEGETDGRFLLLTKITPSAVQPYETVQEQVKADVLADKQQTAFTQLATEKIAKLKQAAKDNTFETVAKAEGFTVNTPAAFGLESPAPEISSAELAKGLVNSQPGDVISDITAQSATALLLVQRDTPAFSLANEKSREVKKQVERAYQRVSSLGYLNEWAQRHGKDSI